MRRTPLVLAAFIAALLAPASNATGGTADTEVFRGPSSDVQYNQCVDEFASTAGTFVMVQHKTETQNGETNTFLFHYEGMTGTGLTTGVRYVETQEITQSSYVSSPTPPMEFTDARTLVLNRLSPTGAITDDDYLLHVTAHGTVSASGQVSPPQFEFKEQCR